MSANSELQRVNEWTWLRGFTTLFRKENRAWWGTRRWWINAFVWVFILCGLMANMMFVPTVQNLASEADVAQAGGMTAYILQMGLTVFFEFGTMALAIGIVILSQDLVIAEKQNGVAEWLLAKPLARRAYVLAKIIANALAALVVLVGLPAAIAYGMLSLRGGALFPAGPFLSALGVMSLHMLFYLALTIALGTIFDSRIPVLGIALGSVLGGSLLGGFFQPLLYVTPWMLAKIASLTASGGEVPAGLATAPLVFTALWSVVFIVVSLLSFERYEF